MHTNNSFIQGQENMKFLVKANSNKEYNNFLFNQVNIKDVKLVSLLDILSPFIYLINVTVTFVFILFKFLSSLFSYRWRVNKNEYENFDELYLFFINHFKDRCKAAKFYENSRYWIISPAIDYKKYDLEGKIIVDYHHYLTKKDAFIIMWSSLVFLIEFVWKVRSLCLIHKIWDFYEVKYSLKRIGKNSTLYFANQSDKYALLFDKLDSKSKVLFQHGIVANWGKLPYRLNNVDKFYAMSKGTWQDAYSNLFANSPSLLIMEPTIKLQEIPTDEFSVLIVAEISYIDIEKIILNELSKDNSIKLYLKKHPALVNDGSYRQLEKQYGFQYIKDKKFPKVDFVISYYSTLAYEYLAYDIPVYMYMTKEEFDAKEMMVRLKNCKENKVKLKCKVDKDN